MDIIYSSEKQPSAEAVQVLFKQTEWAKSRTLKNIQTALDNSVVFGAWDGDKLIAFARVITDGCFRALIEDVVVDEAYRKQGIGAALINLLNSEFEQIEEILLHCADYNIGFYEKLDYKVNDITTMHKWQGE